MKSLIIVCVTVVSFVSSQNLILAQDKKAEEKLNPPQSPISESVDR